MNNFDPTLIEALIGALLTLIGAGAGFGVSRTRADGSPAEPSPLLRQLAELADKQSETTQKVTELIAGLDALVREDLRRIEDQAKRRGRAQRRVTADLDAVSDALDIIVSHIGEQLPEQARVSINAKLERRQRDDITGLH